MDSAHGHIAAVQQMSHRFSAVPHQVQGLALALVAQR